MAGAMAAEASPPAVSVGRCAAIIILGKHKKPFTDQEMIEECMEAVADKPLDGKEGQQFKEKIKQIAMSAKSTTRRGDSLYQDVQTQLNIELLLTLRRNTAVIIVSFISARLAFCEKMGCCSKRQ
ncbi:hypothetical protein ATANTOWER_009944 [Ataeniobius toweri]|uniref:Uncharacterized protein n=1 Tax=Ataeniobius toweri TaxID=208326 RepID=A0ABU7C9T0_9TELE|nr:hypothetical protein [Ataeniobius toweri]